MSPLFSTGDPLRRTGARRSEEPHPVRKFVRSLRCPPRRRFRTRERQSGAPSIERCPPPRSAPRCADPSALHRSRCQGPRARPRWCREDKPASLDPEFLRCRGPRPMTISAARSFRGSSLSRRCQSDSRMRSSTRRHSPRTELVDLAGSFQSNAQPRSSSALVWSGNSATKQSEPGRIVTRSSGSRCTA